jgi:hypothetical protein
LAGRHLDFLAGQAPVGLLREADLRAAADFQPVLALGPAVELAAQAWYLECHLPIRKNASKN